MTHERNTKNRYVFNVPEAGMTIPATLICGNELGQAITISAGVHSREYIGMENWKRRYEHDLSNRTAGSELLDASVA